MKEIDFLDILLILAKKKWFIFWVTLIVSIGAVTYSLLAPQIWQSSAQIMSVSSDAGGFPLNIGGLGNLGSLIGGNNSDASKLVTIINSDPFSEKIIKKFDLIKYFNFSETDSLKIRDKSLLRLKGDIVKTFLNPETNVLTISIATTDKYLSADIANYYCELLDKYNRENSMSKGREKRIFVQKRVDQVHREIDEIGNKLREFQVKNNVISLDEQSKSLVSIYSTLLEKKVENDIAIDYAKKFLTKNNDNIKNLINKQKIINQKLKSFEGTNNERISDYTLPFSSIPDLELKFGKLQAQLEVKKKILEILIPQLEMAKIEEIKDLPTIQVISKAVPRGYRKSPKRAVVCIVSFLFAIFISSGLVVIKELMPNESKQKIREFFKIVFSKK
jgi:uncharacterized protein involved in exopolysaccharide biosynthesis